MFKKVLSGLMVVGVATFLFGNNSHAESNSLETTSPNAYEQPIEFHEGETPIKTFVDEKTGQVVDIFKVSDIVTYGAGSWDHIGSEFWNINGIYNDLRTDSIQQSQGGDYMIRIPAHTVKKISGDLEWTFLDISLYESDPSPNDDDYIDSVGIEARSYAQDAVFRDVGPWVDGVDGNAELYTTHRSNYTITSGTGFTVKYYD